MRADVAALRRELGMEGPSPGECQKKLREKKSSGPTSKTNEPYRSPSVCSLLADMIYHGQNIVAGYRKYFGVDWVCAFKELEILGIAIEPEYKNKVLKSAAGAVAAGRSKKLRRK